MAFIEVIGTIKLEPSMIKPEPSIIKPEASSVVEIYPSDIYHSSDEEEEDNNYTDEIKVEAEGEDGHRDNDCRDTEDLRKDKHRVRNFNKQIVCVTNDDSRKETSNSEKIDWAKDYRVRECGNSLEILKKAKKVYGPSWNKPIQPDEYTFVSKNSMICNYCRRKFEVKKNLAKHIRTLHRGESSVTFHCPYCPKQSRWSLRAHILGKHKDESDSNWYQCYECDKKYRTKTHLIEHVQTHIGNKRYMQAHIEKDHRKKYHCEKCSFVGQDMSLLKKHIEDDHRDNDSRTTENLRKGEGVNNQVVPVTNDEMSEESSNSEKVDWAKVYSIRQNANWLEELKKMKKVYGSSWNKPIQPDEYTYVSKNSMICNYCRRKFEVKRNLAKHIRTLHRGESSVTFHCPYCPKQSRWSLRAHILQTHKDESRTNWFQCYQCDKKFPAKNRLIKHIQTHLGKKKRESPAACPTCGRMFNSKYSMHVHKRRHHEKKYQCEQCSFVGQYLSSLKGHMEEHHTDPNELPIYQCGKCDFKTRYKQSYNSHCKKHETKYVCDKCSFTSHHLEALKLHMHTHKEKLDDETLKYHCKKCDYKTYRQYSLQVHKLNHLKPEEINYFYCYHCNFKAKRKDNLKTHIIRHFKKEEVTLPCFICDFETKKRGALTKHINQHQKSPPIEEN